MSIITALVNQKGGVGKTTTAQNLGAALAYIKKQKTLLVDLDPTGNLSQAFGISSPQYTILEALLQVGKGVKPYHISEDFHLIAATETLSSLERRLDDDEFSHIKFEAGGEYYVLKLLLEEFGKNYDHIIVDCPPSLALLSVNALCVADQILIPMEAQKYSLKCLELVLGIMARIKNKMNSRIELAGLFFTRHRPQTILKSDISRQIQEVIGDKMYHTYIRNNVAIEEATQFNMDIFSYDAYLSKETGKKVHSNGAKDYAALLEEFLGNEIELEARHMKNELSAEEKRKAANAEHKELKSLNEEFKKFLSATK